MRSAIKPTLVIEPQNAATDIHGARFLQIRVRADSRVIWITSERGTLLRVCNIEGPVTIQDDRLTTDAPAIAALKAHNAMTGRGGQ